MRGGVLGNAFFCARWRGLCILGNEINLKIKNILIERNKRNSECTGHDSGRKKMWRGGWGAGLQIDALGAHLICAGARVNTINVPKQHKRLAWSVLCLQNM